MHPREMGRLWELAPRVSQGSTPLVHAPKSCGASLTKPMFEDKIKYLRAVATEH